MNEKQKAVWEEPHTYARQVIHDGHQRWMLFSGNDGAPLIIADQRWSLIQAADANDIIRPETLH